MPGIVLSDFHAASQLILKTSSKQKRSRCPSKGKETEPQRGEETPTVTRSGRQV